MQTVTEANAGHTNDEKNSFCISQQTVMMIIYLVIKKHIKNVKETYSVVSDTFGPPLYFVFTPEPLAR